MSRAIYLLACSVTLLAVVVSGTEPTGAPGQDRTAAAKSKKGKIKRPHRVPITPGTPLILYLHTDDLAGGDQVFADDLTATYTGYTLTPMGDPVVVPASGSDPTLLKVTFSVARALKAGGKSTPDQQRDRGTGDLTITLNTTADGSSSVTNIPAYGE